MIPASRKIRVACRRCDYNVVRTLKAGDERTLDVLNTSLRCGKCHARASNGLVNVRELEAQSAEEFERLRAELQARLRAQRRPGVVFIDDTAERRSWRQDRGKADTPPPAPEASSAEPDWSFLAGAARLVVSAIGIAAGGSAAFAVLFAVGAVVRKGVDTVFHAFDYELADTIRHSPNGGYYDR